MKKIIFIFGLVVAIFYSISADAQTTTKLKAEVLRYKTERDSLDTLYKFVLDKYDFVAVANSELEKKMEQTSLQLTNLKTEIESILLKKKEAQTEMENAKKLIEQLVTKLDELETEVKRLKEIKKKQR